ncbi:hypothetical protein MMC25_003225 [Agyrium rufum]|nr:hypothetical protein [Agyrium rufum]
MNSSIATSPDAQADRGPTVIGAHVALGFLACLAVTLRVAARRIQDLPLKADDYTIIIALILSICLIAGTCASVPYGLGRHLYTLDPPNIVKYVKTQVVFEILWAAALPLVKISILFLYVRLFPTRNIRIAAWILGLISIAVGLIGIFGGAFQCQPIERIWDKSIPGHCIDGIASLKSTSIINVALDFVVLITPLPVIWKLQLSWRRKMLVMGVFLLGSLTCITGIVRLVVINSYVGNDISWRSVDVTIWSTAEPTLGIVSACLPMMPAIYHRFFNKKKGSANTAYGSGRSPIALTDATQRASRIRGQSMIARNDQEGFERLDDFPLRNLEKGREKTDIGFAAHADESE